MKSCPRKHIFLRIVASFMITGLFANWQVNESVAAQGVGNDVLYTTDADFDQGTLVSVNHNAPGNNQLQLDSQTKPFPFINVAASGRGTVVRANTETGETVGEYRTAPEGRGLNPSRTTVDLFGNVWTANRDEVGTIDGVPNGSAVKIGLIVGGTRVDATGTPDPEGGYLAPPYGYNTCVDRNADGLIRTSKGLGDILDWPDVTDGPGGTDGLVQDAVDECILIYQRLPNAEQARHVSVDADNNVWVGGYPFVLRMFYKLDGSNGAILDSFDARKIGCGGYGGLIDGNGILWSVGGALLRYDPVTKSGFCIQQYGYGLGIDTNGYIWMSLWDGGIVKVAPDGTVVPGFPKPTFPPSMMTSLAVPEVDSMLAATSQDEAVMPLPVPPERPVAASRPASGDEQMQSLSQSEAATAFAPLAEDPSVTFQVAPVDNWVQASSQWTPGASISLTIEDGGTVVYSDSQTADSNGYFNFNLWDRFDLQRGQVVTVSDGTTTKTHTVANVFVDRVDITADMIVGRADPNATVEIWADGGYLSVTADGSGNWTADFSGMVDLTYLSSGGLQQRDENGDYTWLWWSGPQIQVAPDDNWVQSMSPWTAGATISLTIEQGGTVVYSDSQVTNADGNFNFSLWDKVDLQRGQVVTVSDGTATKTHTVIDYYVDGVDTAADTVFGRAAPGTDVEVWSHQDGNQTVTVDGSGHWTADFSGSVDLTYRSDGGSRVRDDDGDSTGVWWSSPKFQVSVQDDWVESSRSWTPGTTISLTIEEGGAIVYSDSQATDPNGNFHFELRNMFDIRPGQVVTVSDGTTTKIHTVIDFSVDGVDIAADTVFGQAQPGTSVEVWVNNNGNQTVTADGSGHWLADFSGVTDITYRSDGGSRQYDDDGDATNVWWSSPRFQVAPADDWVQSSGQWTSGATISLTIEAGGVVVYSDSQTANANGYFNFNLWNAFDIQRGQVVTVSDGTITKSHTVTNLFVDRVDVATDTVAGRADPGSSVRVWASGGNPNLDVTADGSGNWMADFSSMAGITYLSDGNSEQIDEDGDSTWLWWAPPRFQVAPEDEWVQSWSPWTPGTTITLTIEDAGAVVYSDSQLTDVNGNFNFNLWDKFDLQRGQVVTVSDGTVTKTHTVIDYYVDGVDIAADTVFGRAAPGTDVEVWSHQDGNQTVTVDGSGHWTADFSGRVDLTYISDGGSRQYDDDGDSTGVWWSSPSIQVSPDDNWVQQWNRWKPGTTVSLTVEDGGTVVYSDSQVTDVHGNFNFTVSAIDLVPGQQVTVSDGTTTKTHTVIDISDVDIDTDADQIRGTASPDARVWVWVNLFDNGSGRWAVADASGNWMVDFSVPGDGQPVYNITGITRIGVNEFDENNDSSFRQFGPPSQQSRGVAVTPVDNNVWVANSAYGTVTRLDNDGNVIKVIETGAQPTGVAIDAAGKVWATNMGSSNAVRIDPSAGSDGLGEIDLTVDLGADASPYNYSDMTGTVAVGSTSPQGFWTVIQDGETLGFQWGRITWNTEPQGNEPPGTAIVVEARAADTEAGLGGETFQPVSSGDLFSMIGRFIEVRATLKASPEGVSPVLSDIRIQPSVIGVKIDIKPGSYPNTINCKNWQEVITVAILTTADFDALTVDHRTVTFEGAREIHMNWWTHQPIRHVGDVDHDGDLDLVFHFRLRDTALTCASTTGQLQGLTYAGIPIVGTDSVRMIKTCKFR